MSENMKAGEVGLLTGSNRRQQQDGQLHPAQQLDFTPVQRNQGKNNIIYGTSQIIMSTNSVTKTNLSYLVDLDVFCRTAGDAATTWRGTSKPPLAHSQQRTCYWTLTLLQTDDRDT